MAGVANDLIEVEASERTGAGAIREVEAPLERSGRRLRIILTTICVGYVQCRLSRRMV
jgi:hypothetical protein